MNLRSRGIGLLVVMVVAGLNSSSFARAAGSVSGTVSDSQGARIPNAHIQLRWNPRSASGGVVTGKLKGSRKAWKPHKEWLQVNTDSVGQFSIEVPAGNWDVFAYLDGFTPSCTVVSVEAEKTTKVELRLGFAPMSLN